MVSQSERILTDLKLGRTITALEALDRYGCFRLASRINDLKNDGHNIQKRDKRLPSGKVVAEYWLEKGPQMCLGI